MEREARIRRIPRDYQKFEVLNLFTALQAGKAIHNPDQTVAFLESVREGLQRALTSSSTLHGLRTQSLFEQMVVNLGKVLLLKQEDAGDCYGEGVRPPDFRILTRDQAMLVEVKNHHRTDPAQPFRIPARSLRELQQYASLVKTPLRLAIYWARYNTWTLNDPDRLQPSGKYKIIDLVTAIKESSMAELGDSVIGTRQPLTLTINADTRKPQIRDASGWQRYIIHSREFACAGKPVLENTAQNVALYLMTFGKWDYSSKPFLADDGLIQKVEYLFAPPAESPDDHDDIAIIGSLSSLFSTFYNLNTIEGETVSAFARVDNPPEAALILRDLPHFDDLPLWHFIQKPNLGGDSE
jgi:hypothetical protein